MSVPRIAIQRPVTMFMLSGVIVLLGGISLFRLPVDLMPDVTYPTITVRVGYGGVGPAEIEQLIVRPLEQTLAAVPGLDQMNSTASEGSGNVRLNFAWGTNLNEAADEIRTRIDRVRGRLPTESDPPNISKFDSAASPIMGIGVEGDFDRVTLREMAELDIAPRLERVEGVAAVTVSGGLRRQIHIELSKEKITALDLSVDRVVSTIRSENQNVPLGEILEGDTNYLLRSPGEFRSLDQIRDLVIQTKGGVPVYLRDLAEIKDTTEDLRSFTRINKKAGVRLQVSKQSGKNTVAIAQGLRAEIERINRDMRNVNLTVLDDQSKFIERSIGAVKEAVYFGAVLVIAIIFIFLRNIRSTVIICTSIPISIVGTFALLYFSGFTLNTMTFGGLALGVGMIVDASIVVLENTFRHMEHGKPRMQAAIEGSEEVWSAILASTLTHIAVFVPLLFLSGVSSILFVQLSIVVMFSLGMSLFVAVTVVPVLCSRLLKLPPPVDQRKGLAGRLYTISERGLEKMDDTYRAALHVALGHRAIVIGAATALTVGGVHIDWDHPHRARPADRRRRSHGLGAAGQRNACRAQRADRSAPRGTHRSQRARDDNDDQLRGRRRRRDGRHFLERQRHRQAQAAHGARPGRAIKSRPRFVPSSSAFRGRRFRRAPRAATSSSRARSAAATRTAGSRSRYVVKTSMSRAASRVTCSSF